MPRQWLSIRPQVLQFHYFLHSAMRIPMPEPGRGGAQPDSKLPPDRAGMWWLSKIPALLWIWHMPCLLPDVSREDARVNGSKASLLNISEDLQMRNKGKMLTAVYRDRDAANRAYEWLESHGYSPSEINVLMSDRTRTYFSSKGTDAKIKAGDKAVEGVATGGTIGTAVGATLGALLALGTSVVIPGLGFVVAGPVLAGLAGGGAGAIAGGLVGGLVGLGIPESNAQAYEEALNNGGVVFGIVPHSNEDADNIMNYFEKHGAENIVYAETR